MKKFASVSLPLLATLFFFIIACNSNDTRPGDPATPARPTTPNISYNITSTQPHDTSFFTEGLEFYKNTLIESTGMNGRSRLVQVDQKSIGRTPRSNLATYTGLFDHVRKLFAETDKARNQVERFAEKKADKFDKDWCKEMMDKHDASIKKLEKEQNDADDADLKAWITETLPVIRSHHDKLMACHSKLK